LVELDTGEHIPENPDLVLLEVGEYIVATKRDAGVMRITANSPRPSLIGINDEECVPPSTPSIGGKWKRRP
jgi:hypothetical protein